MSSPVDSRVEKLATYKSDHWGTYQRKPPDAIFERASRQTIELCESAGLLMLDPTDEALINKIARAYDYDEWERAHRYLAEGNDTPEARWAAGIIAARQRRAVLLLAALAGGPS